jgi:predicted GNAT family acetyltransferase
VIRSSEGELRIADAKTTFCDIEHAARPAEVVHDVVVNVQQEEIVAEIGHDVIVPDLRKQGLARHLHSCSTHARIDSRSVNGAFNRRFT